MKPSQIKTECELIYTQIKSLQERLIRLRSICKHIHLLKGIDPYIIDEQYREKTCTDCGKILPPKWLNLADINRKEI